jgi:hypothetical protein
MHMDFLRHESRLACLAALACALALNACAHRPGTSIAATETTPPAPHIPDVDHRKPTPPVPRERRASLQTIPSRTQPSKTEQIVALVRGGYLVSQDQGALVFSKSGLTRSSRSGLYEDAILLARLRRTLKEIAGLPEAISASATVRDARAYLSIEDGLSASTAASAIDAGLRTPGIIAVQARVEG